MNDILNLGSWGPTQWEAADKTACEVFEQQTRVRRAVPAGRAQPNAHSVTVPRLAIDHDTLVLATDAARPPIRLFSTFRVRGEQLHDMETIARLAGRAARRLAFMEDLVLAFGGQLRWSEHETRSGVTQRGLTHETPGVFSTPLWADFPVSGIRGSNPTELVRLAIAKLQARGSEAVFGPYSVLMMGRLWEAANSSATQNGTRTHLDTLRAFLGDAGRAEPVPNPPPVVASRDSQSEAGVALLRAAWALGRLRTLAREDGHDGDDAAVRAIETCKRVAIDAPDQSPTDLSAAARAVDAAGVALADRIRSPQRRGVAEAIERELDTAIAEVDRAAVGSYPPDFDSRGVVLARDPSCFELVQVEAPSIGLGGYDGGDLVMQLQEAFLLRVLDPSATLDIMLAP